MVNVAQSVAARLDAEVAAGRMQWNGAQLAAAQRLDALREALATVSPSVFRRLRTAIPWLPGDARSAPRGVYLWGGVGRGKTLLMDLFFASIMETAAAGSAERFHFYRFMHNVHEILGGIKHHAEPLEIVAQSIAARARVICLDELFVADIADAMILAGLFDGLFRRGVALVATSNLQPQDLYKDGLQRQRFLPAIDLLRANVDVIHLDGAIDYRLRQLEQAPIYLDSNAPDAAAAMQTHFAALTGGFITGPCTLTVGGRPMAAINAGPGSVWFQFSDLCEGPRSQLDYIELARLYQTVFISKIPCFSDAEDNAARRFIMLIDEFYDRSVKIVVSAAAAPAALYGGERLRFEFERAASRLIEMQTQHYLAGQHRP